MITSAVRGLAVAALTSAFALLPASAHAEEKDADNDIERVELVGVSGSDTTPVRDVRTSDGWTNHLDLYTEVTDGSGRKSLRHAGDGTSECSAIAVQGPEVTAACTRVLRLAKGTLTLSDVIRYRSGERVTAKTGITAGTGHYRAAYGEGRITLEGRQVALVLDVDE
ncbi:hypothetical protein [Streptomyces djakartensis]|uniref:Secreted protein n=1 Tax=Streptomyces djakartensis TaxID=68193 RepID=A0ABQ2Z3V5_9ACTN|nr:hypothetical protein [Streptomyces djakartensis]GGY01473.1 hypothetical protein GCM10010384_01330 [Streptomyces djakartensis]